MQVILLDKVANLGTLGDQVNVKAGYARNFLVPQGKAVPATKKNVEFFEARRAELNFHKSCPRISPLMRSNRAEGKEKAPSLARS